MLVDISSSDLTKDLPGIQAPGEKRREAATFSCAICGTRIRPGQPHSALEPEPHQTVGALVVHEYPRTTEARDGSHGILDCAGGF